jgi:hypothetical protein
VSAAGPPMLGADLDVSNDSRSSDNLHATCSNSRLLRMFAPISPSCFINTRQFNAILNVAVGNEPSHSWPRVRSSVVG